MNNPTIRSIVTAVLTVAIMVATSVFGLPQSTFCAAPVVTIAAPK